MKPIRLSTSRLPTRLGRPLPILNLPATESVELGGGLRYEGLWVDGRWEWTLWLDAVQIRSDPASRFGSNASN